MGKKSKQYENEQIVDCESCDGVISLEFYLRSGDVVCCEECGAEYLVNSRKPLRLQLLEEDDDFDEDEDEDEGFDEDEDEDGSYNVIPGYGDDDYDDGRYD